MRISIFLIQYYNVSMVMTWNMQSLGFGNLIRIGGCCLPLHVSTTNTSDLEDVSLRVPRSTAWLGANQIGANTRV